MNVADGVFVVDKIIGFKGFKTEKNFLILMDVGDILLQSFNFVMSDCIKEVGK